MNLNLRLRLINFYPPLLGAGIRAHFDPKDPHTVRVRMPLTWLNRNIYGTHFGGSLYAMCDAFFALILLRNLGKGYLVWDKAATIRFLRPGRGTVHACFHIPPARVEEIRAQAENGEPVEPVFTVELVDDAGETVALVEKLLYVRKAASRSTSSL